MKRLFEQIEELGMNDPVVFSWMNMRKRSRINDDEALIYLVKALINSKNMALRVIDKNKQDNKVVRLRR